MGTQREPREDTPVEFVEVDLLAVLGVSWGRGYTHARTAVASALRDAEIPFSVHDPNQLPGSKKGIFLSVTHSPRPGFSRSVHLQKEDGGLNIWENKSNLPDGWSLIPDGLLRCRVRLKLTSLVNDELRQLGLTRATR